MKRSTRLLTVLLAFLFLFNTMLPAAQAIGYDSKKNVVLTPEESANLFLDYADKLLKQKGGVFEKSFLSIKAYVDYRSIDSALSTAYTTVKENQSLLSLVGGDLSNLNVDALKNLQRSGGNMNVLNKMIQFLNTNKAILKNAVTKGKVSMSVGDPIEVNVNSMALDAIYNALLKGDDGLPRENTAYKSATADTMLNDALKNLLKEEFSFFTAQDLATVNVNNLSVYSIFKDYIGLFFKNLALEPLNKDFKKALASLAGASYDAQSGQVTPVNANEFYDKINWGYEFTETTYDFNAGFTLRGGLVNQINDLLYMVFKTVLEPEVFAGLQLEKGGNNVLNSNIEKIAKFILPLCPAELFNDSFDPKTADVDAMGFEEIVAHAFRAVIESAPEIIASVIKLTGLPVEDFEIPDGEIVFPAGVATDTIEKLAVYSIQSFAKQTLPDYYDSYHDAAINAALNSAPEEIDKNLVNAFLDIFMDVVVYYADEYLPINLPETTVKKYKNANWGWEDFLDEIIDWVLNDYVKNTLSSSLTIPESSRKRGVTDDYGVWKKINTLANGLLPLGFLNDGTNDGTCDLEHVVKNLLMGNFFDVNFAGMLSVIEENNNSGNILNMKIVPGLLTVVQKIVNAILPNTIQNGHITTLDTFLKGSTLGDILEKAITSLEGRKSELLPSILPLAGSLLFDKLGGEHPDDSTVKLAPPQVTYFSSTTKLSADFRIISTFSQAEAATLFKIPLKKFAGWLGTDGLVEIGTLVALKSTMTQKGWDTLDLDKAKDSKVFSAKSDYLYNDNAKADGSGYYYFATKIMSIEKAKYSEAFYAVGYVKYKLDDGSTAVLYTRGKTYVVNDY